MKRKRNGLFYSKKEETINSISHGIGIAMGVIVGTLFLIKCYQAQNLWAAFGVWLYLFGMGGSYLASTLYHSLKHHNPWKRRLRHWDHAAIYWHIAGSYSPITLIALREDGGWGWGLFGFVWLCAIIGTVVSFRKMEEHSYVETVCRKRMVENSSGFRRLDRKKFQRKRMRFFWEIGRASCRERV